MAGYKRFIRKREHLERVRVVGPMSQSQAVLQAMHADGWRSVRTGPYVRKWPTVDQDQFLFLMERETHAD